MMAKGCCRLHNSQPIRSSKAFEFHPPGARLRRTGAVRVANVAAPSSGVSARSLADIRDSILRHAPVDTPESGQLPAVTSAQADTRTVEDAANLERLASGELATTSAPAARQVNDRRTGSKGNNSAVKGKRAPARVLSSPQLVADSSPGATATAENRSRAATVPVNSRLDRNRPFDARGFTALVTGAGSVAELQLLFEYGRDAELNAIHLATLWSRLAKLVAAEHDVAAAGSRSSGGSEQGGASSASGRQHRPGVTEFGTLKAFVAALEAATTPEKLAGMEARGLASVIWAAAKMTHEVVGGADAAATQAAAAAMSEEAAQASRPVVVQKVDLGSEGAEGRAAGEAAGEEQPRPRPLRLRGGKRALAAKEAAAAAVAAAAAARQRALVSPEFLESWAAAADGKLATFNMIDASNVTWALGRLDFQPKGMFMRRLCVLLVKELPRADRPQQVSNILLGLALLRFVPPVRDFWQPVWEAMQRVVLAEQKSPDLLAISNSLWSLGQLTEHCPETMVPVPEALLSRAVFRAVQWGNRITPTQCQDVLASLPRLGFEPSDYQAAKLHQLAASVLKSADPMALSNILLALLQIKTRPRNDWMHDFGRAFRPHLETASHEALTRVLYCFGLMRYNKVTWLPEAWYRLRREAHLLKATDIAFTVYAVRRLYPRLSPTSLRGSQLEAAPGDARTNAVGQGHVAEADEEDAADVQVAAEGRGQKGEEEELDGEAAKQRAQAARAAAILTKQQSVREANRPSRRVLVGLWMAWKELKPEAKLSVVFDLRADVEEFLAAIAAPKEQPEGGDVEATA